MNSNATRKNSQVSRLIYLTLILALLAAVVPLSVSAAVPSVSAVAQTACAAKHTVVAGETLSSIAVLYDVEWQDIAEANNLQDPYVITIGQVLCIPEGATVVPDDDEDTTDQDADTDGPTFLVSVDEDYFLNIKTIDYPKNTSFIVRVSPFETRWSYLDFLVLGRFSTDKNGSSDALIRLPREYRDQVLLIGLKNAINDKVQYAYFDPSE